MQKVNLSFLLLLVALPVYAHHVPGDVSARVDISIPGCTHEACNVSLTTATSPALNCRKSIDGKRDWTCNLPQGFRIPAIGTTPPTGTPVFEFTRTTAATDPLTQTPLGAEFKAKCNAASETSACNNLTSLSFQNTTIRKVSAGTAAAQRVQVKLGFTLGLLPDNSLNDSTLDATVGFSHTFSSRGSFVPSGALAALNNTHSAAYSFTYVLSSATCGTTAAGTPEPFDIPGCTVERVIPCVGPTSTGVSCGAGGGSYQVMSSTDTLWNSITRAGAVRLEDLVQRTCGNLFTTGNPTCRSIERQTATLSYGFVRQNDKVNLTGSAVGASGLIGDVLTVSAGESLKCRLHESGGGTSINPNDNGQFKVQVFGSAAIPTSTMEAQNTFIGLPGGAVIPAKEIRYNQTFSDPETGDADAFFDAWVVFDSSDLAPLGDITCAQYGGQTVTLLLQSEADVTVSGVIKVAGKGKKGEKSFGSFTTTTPDAPISCEIPATVGPCNNP